MAVTNPLSFLSPQLIKVWVLAPHLVTHDANIDYYYDFTQSIAEYEKTFSQLGIEWKWQPVTMQDYPSIIDKIAKEKDTSNKTPVVFNICDGDEINGTPGISVIKLLEEKGLLYTGANEYFYNITTSKIPMKRAFDKAKVPTAGWKTISTASQNFDKIFKELGNPVIVKPAISGGSMGVGIKNVVQSAAELKSQVSKMLEGYRGWNLAADGLVAESFISGPEFTVLISGTYNNPELEKFLSFDRLWEIYEDETPMPGEASFYEYALPDALLIDEIKQISWDAYVATKGCGYTRIDIRMDTQTGKLYVLEVNAQCGLSEDEDYTSIGAILRFSGSTYTELIAEIINDAFTRRSAAAQKRRYA